MGTRRDVWAFVLLVQLMSLSAGHIEAEFQNMIPESVSSVSIANNSREKVDEVLENMSSLNGGYNNFSIAPKTKTVTGMATGSLTGLLEDKKILENQLKEALERVSPGDQLILISALRNDDKSLEKPIFKPLILIENPSRTLESSIERSIDRQKINIPDKISDQELGQSQIRGRLIPKVWADEKDVENTEDLLAITEYEPQKLDPVRGPEVPSAKGPGGHQDGAGQRNTSRTPQNYGAHTNRPLTKVPNPEGSTRELIPAALPSDRFQTQRSAPKLKLIEYHYETERKRYPLTSGGPKQAPGSDGPRETRHLKPSTSLKKDPTLPTADGPETIEGTWKIPDVKNGGGERPTDETPAKKLEELPIPEPPLPTGFPGKAQNQIAIDPEKAYDRRPSGSYKAAQKAERRVGAASDPLEKPGQVQPHWAPNEKQLGYFTRYNLPSLVMPRLAGTRSYPPLPSLHRPPIAGKDTNNEEEAQSKWRSIGNDARNSISDRPNNDYYDDSDEGQPGQGAVMRTDVHPPRDVLVGATKPSSYDHEELTAPESLRKDINPISTSNNPFLQGQDAWTKIGGPGLTSQAPNFYPGPDQHRTLAPAPPLGFQGLPAHQPYGHLGRMVRPLGPIVPPNVRMGPHEGSPPPKFPVDNLRVDALPSETLPTSRNLGSGGSDEAPEATDRNFRQSGGKSRHSNGVYDRHDSLKNLPPSWLTPGVRESGVHDQRSHSALPGITHGTVSSVSGVSVNRQKASVNRRKASDPLGVISSPYHHERSHIDSDEVGITNTEKIYSSTLAKPRVQKVHSEARQNSREKSYTGEAPDYDSQESEEHFDVSPSSIRATTNEPESANYGRRVRPLLVAGHGANLQPRLSAPTRQTRPVNLPIERNEKPRIAGKRVHDEPAESVQRADVIDRARGREDEESASSGREENHVTHEKSKKNGHGDEKSEEGGGDQHEEGHHESGDEKAEKGYKEWHEYDKGKKGHHDKENHEKEYEESEGGKKKHEDESGYHKEHHHDEKEEKEAEYGEKGEHQKGHSTKGQHVVHKKDEYEKKTEFYDESHEEDGNEKEGEYRVEHENKKGGHEKIGHHDSAHHVDKYGKKGEKIKGRHWDEIKGHDNKDGHEREHHHEEKYGKKSGHEEGMKWSHTKGENRKR